MPVSLVSLPVETIAGIIREVGGTYVFTEGKSGAGNLIKVMLVCKQLERIAGVVLWANLNITSVTRATLLAKNGMHAMRQYNITNMTIEGNSTISALVLNMLMYGVKKIRNLKLNTQYGAEDTEKVGLSQRDTMGLGFAGFTEEGCEDFWSSVMRGADEYEEGAEAPARLVVDERYSDGETSEDGDVVGDNLLMEEKTPMAVNVEVWEPEEDGIATGQSTMPASSSQGSTAFIAGRLRRRCQRRRW